MKVFPVINCADAVDAKEKIDVLALFLAEGDFVHVDVADGIFSFHKTWNNPTGWRDLDVSFQIEAHLMVENPHLSISPWLKAGVKRFIVHIETINVEVVESLLQLCAGVELGFSSDPETPAEKMRPYLNKASFFQVLGVNPGLAGQKFLPRVLEKVKWIRKNAPHAIIEVDGGMDPETAKLAKEAGADIVVSSSYIFGSKDPEKAYEELRQL